MAHIVVLGAGLGGTLMAYEMKDQLRPGDTLTVVTKDPKYDDLYVKRLGFRSANMDVDQFNAYLRRSRAEFEEFAKEMGLQKK